MKRKSPSKHKVKKHIREGKSVRSHTRGKGQKKLKIIRRRVIDSNIISQKHKMIIKDVSKLDFIVNEFFANEKWCDYYFTGNCDDFAVAFNRLIDNKGEIFSYSGVHFAVKYKGKFWDAHGAQTSSGIVSELGLDVGFIDPEDHSFGIYKWEPVRKGELSTSDITVNKIYQKLNRELKKVVD